MTQIFVDMDGVLADFDAHYEAVFGSRPSVVADNVDWAAVRGVKDFYLNIPPMPDLAVLWDFIGRFRPIVLTGVPRSVIEAPENKKSWVVKNIGEDIEVRCVRSSEKCLHAKPGDILIDDWIKYRHLWLKKGGRWITHRNAEQTVHALMDLGIGL